MRNLSVQVLSASDGSNQTSAAIDANQIISASFVASFSDGSGAGTVQIQASNDPVPANNLYADFTPSNWVNVPGTTATATAAAGGAVMVYTPAGFVARHLRVVFTRTGGAGIITVNMNAIGV